MHLLPGRLRVYSEEIKTRPETEEPVRAMLQRIPGVLAVKTNRLTGSVTVTFDESVVSGYAILNALINVGAASNVIPLPLRKSVQRQNELTLSPAQKILLKRIAGTAFKLALPILVERYLGKSASKVIGSLV